ncbi:hypothetical protein K1719_004668 [Acacia pycnantha]|nr:hypothetical protein K1719_004668 [Acacia pycnantha]
MIGHREGPLMRNNSHSVQKSRDLVAIAIGVFVGCVCAFLFPSGFFGSYAIPRSSQFQSRGIQDSCSIFNRSGSFYISFWTYLPSESCLGRDFIQLSLFPVHWDQLDDILGS